MQRAESGSGSVIQCTDPRLRTRRKISRIWNTSFRRSKKLYQYLMCCTIFAPRVLKMFEYLAFCLLDITSNLIQKKSNSTQGKNCCTKIKCYRRLPGGVFQGHIQLSINVKKSPRKVVTKKWMNEWRNLLFGFLHWIPSSYTKRVPHMQAQQAKINFL